MASFLLLLLLKWIIFSERQRSLNKFIQSPKLSVLHVSNLSFLHNVPFQMPLPVRYRLKLKQWKNLGFLSTPLYPYHLRIIHTLKMLEMLTQKANKCQPLFLMHIDFPSTTCLRQSCTTTTTFAFLCFVACFVVIACSWSWNIGHHYHLNISLHYHPHHFHSQVKMRVSEGKGLPFHSCFLKVRALCPAWYTHTISQVMEKPHWPSFSRYGIYDLVNTRN